MTESFYKSRTEALGVNSENNRFRINNPEAEHPMPKSFECDIFSEDKDGNIKIMFWTLDRQLITYTRMGDGKMSHVNGKPEHYFQLRLKEPQGDKKYSLPSGKWLAREGKSKTWPWLPPQLVEAWEKGEEMETIFLTEGVFKAFMASRLGMPTVGLTSITHYADSEGNLHPDVQRLITGCKVKNVVVLWDGDCRNISESALAGRRDLAERPLGFYASAKKIRKLIGAMDFPEGHEKPAVYFYHVQSDIYDDKPKGLDDLLISGQRRGDVDSIVKQALQPQKASTFFFKIDLTDTTVILRQHFKLHDREEFYKFHAHEIGKNEFKFFNDLLKWNDEKDELELIAPAWAEELFWVGNEYFMEVDVPSINGATRKELSPRNVATLSKRFGSNFWRFLSPFDGFCNVPNHVQYQQVIEVNGKKFYNQYFPFKHVPKAGDWSHIKMFLQHIFGTDMVTHAITGEEIPRWHLGLDYVQLLYLRPTQQLPVLILYSPENKTGKSTFGLLMAAMFGDNVVPIGNSDLQSDFNSTYSAKLLAVCEETLLERKKEAERIKAISTSPRILVNPKGQAQYQIDFFCKFIFTSNNPRMIYVNRHDTRFWILQVPQLTKEIPNFLKIMESEIPALLHHLQNRELASKHEGRMHFHDSLLKTDAFEATVKVNEPSAASDLREAIIEMFLHDPKLDRIEMPLAEIRKQFFGGKTSTGWIQEILRDYLLVEQVIGHDGKAKVKRGSYTIWETATDGQLMPKEIQYIGRPYVFLRKDFVKDVNPKDYEEIAAEEKAQAGSSMIPAKPLSEPAPADDLPF